MTGDQKRQKAAQIRLAQKKQTKLNRENQNDDDAQEVHAEKSQTGYSLKILLFLALFVICLVVGVIFTFVFKIPIAGIITAIVGFLFLITMAWNVNKMSKQEEKIAMANALAN